MTEMDRLALALVSRILEYPDRDFFAFMPAFREDMGEGQIFSAISGVLDALEKAGPNQAAENYVATFDHDPAHSLHMAWHRYGNDRSQGRAMGALNALYREAGYEPIEGTMPDYLPRMLEFLSVCDEWAAEALLDGFGPELGALHKSLTDAESIYAPALGAAMRPLRDAWPTLFMPRTKPDPTARPMANPEQEDMEVMAVAQRHRPQADYSGRDIEWATSRQKK